MIHEGGYSEAYVPFCGLALMEELSSQKTEVVDPYIEGEESLKGNPLFDDLQKQILDEVAEGFRL